MAKRPKPSSAPRAARAADATVSVAGAVLRVLGTILLIVLVTGLLFLCIFAYYVKNCLSTDLDVQLSDFTVSLSSSILYEDSDGNWQNLTNLSSTENRVWVDYADIPKDMEHAAVAIEDKRFYKHKGVDWYRTTGAFINMFLSMKNDFGGSTITQQLIKNLTKQDDITVQRKLLEIFQALEFEKSYDKEEIMEWYLNIVYFGEGCNGVYTAAETYFGKDVSELNLAECATLAVITKAPTKYNPLLNPEANKTRQELCLKYMLEEKAISKEEYEEAVNYKLVFTNSEGYVPKPGKTKNTTEDKNTEKEYQDFYVDYVIKTVCKDLMSKYGYTYRQAMEKINYGGLKIYSAANPDVQKVLNTVYSNRIAFDKEADTAEHPAAQSAATVMDYEGRIVGIVGQAGEKNGNLCLNRASESPRQPGSSIKPLSTYSLALEKNYVNWSSMILDYSIYQNGKLWPQNADGTNGSKKEITVQYAIQKSFNTVPVRIITEMLGVNEAYNFMKKTFHLTTLDDSADANIAPLATGALTNGVTTVEMAAAYAVFGNNGYYYEPYCYYKVTNATGTEVLLETKSEPERVLSEDTAEVMRELLKTVPASSS